MNDVRDTALPYRNLLYELHNSAAAQEDGKNRLSLSAEQLQELQSCWTLGLLGNKGTSLAGQDVHILDFGKWARDGHFDFEHVELEIDGQWRSGGVLFTTQAEDWNRLGYATKSDYDPAILHICLHASSRTWQSKNSRQQIIPTLCLDNSPWRECLRLPAPLDRELLTPCRAPLEHFEEKQLLDLLLSAAAHRLLQKRQRFEQRAAIVGASQCWYEAWAESLGYYENRFAMRVLAQRLPLAELLKHRENAEALLLGVAGFLTPKLPETASDEVRHYHRSIWDAWWTLRAEHALEGRHALNWTQADTRPVNHPHRRVAALACTVERWQEFEPLLSAQKLRELSLLIASLRHPYWQKHSSLPSAGMARASSLVGKQRVKAFLVNHLLVIDQSKDAWTLYQQQRENSVPRKIRQLAIALAGERGDLQGKLSHCVVQQGLLQLAHDFTVTPKARASNCFPAELANI